jgi:hypothetical protein
MEMIAKMMKVERVKSIELSKSMVTLMDANV